MNEIEKQFWLTVGLVFSVTTVCLIIMYIVFYNLGLTNN